MTQSDRDLLVALHAAHAGKSLEQLIKICNSQAEYGCRTRIALQELLRRLDGQSRPDRRVEDPEAECMIVADWEQRRHAAEAWRTRKRTGPVDRKVSAAGPALSVTASDAVDSNVSDAESGAKTVSSNLVESDADDDNQDDDIEIIQSVSSPPLEWRRNS